jgi:hypothetical protein
MIELCSQNSSGGLGANDWTVFRNRDMDLGMQRVSQVKPLRGYRLHVEFTDGVKGEIDMADRLFGPVFEPLKNWQLFSQVSVDEFGVPCWPNGADLAPDALYQTRFDESALGDSSPASVPLVDA